MSIISWPFLAGLFAVVVAAWVVWWTARRRRHPWAVALLAAALVLTFAGVADGVNYYFGYLPRGKDLVSVAEGADYWTPYSSIAAMSAGKAAQKYPHGAVVRMPMPDSGSGFGASAALVWLPPQYFTQPQRQFPVVYLIHGSPGVPADWFRGGEAGSIGAGLAASGHPLILVAPRMSHGWTDDPECVDGVKEKVETHFVSDVVPAIDQTLRTIHSRNSRAIAGNSAGGFCALNLGLRHRDLFSVIVDMSGETHPTHSGGLSKLFGQGPGAAAAIAANSPDQYGQTLSATPPMRVWLDCGTSDQGPLRQLREMQSILVGRGIPTQLHTRRGAHTFHVWVPALRESLTWAAPDLDS